MSKTYITAKEIQANCALGKGCNCTKKPTPWGCKNWAKSKLANPNIISAYSTHKTTERP
jgi:hypothetical protein